MGIMLGNALSQRSLQCQSNCQLKVPNVIKIDITILFSFFKRKICMNNEESGVLGDCDVISVSKGSAVKVSESIVSEASPGCLNKSPVSEDLYDPAVEQPPK